jgi:hypothetical protein
MPAHDSGGFHDEHTGLPTLTPQRHAHKTRSAGISFGRFTDRCKTPIW